MASEILYVKNMVCNRCIQVVKEELLRLGIEVQDVQLGEVRLTQPVSVDKMNEIREVFTLRGFEILEDSTSKLIEQIKTAIIDLVHNPEIVINQNVSLYLEKLIGKRPFERKTTYEAFTEREEEEKEEAENASDLSENGKAKPEEEEEKAADATT